MGNKASCFTVSNLYYNQTILNRIAETFKVSFERASSVATLMQAGYAGGLLFLCPLGDLFPRRPFIIGLIWFTATMVFAQSSHILLTCSNDPDQ
jgi:hypothetical protein